MARKPNNAREAAAAEARSRKARAARLRAAALTDVPFDRAVDVDQIELRLHPLDVGFDVRAHGMRVAVLSGARLRASYPREDGERWVVEGPRAAVIARLEALGFAFVPVVSD